MAILPKGTLGRVWGHLWLSQMGGSWHRVAGGPRRLLTAPRSAPKNDPAPKAATLWLRNYAFRCNHQRLLVPQ